MVTTSVLIWVQSQHFPLGSPDGRRMTAHACDHTAGSTARKRSELDPYPSISIHILSEIDIHNQVKFDDVFSGVYIYIYRYYIIILSSIYMQCLSPNSTKLSELSELSPDAQGTSWRDFATAWATAARHMVDDVSRFTGFTCPIFGDIWIYPPSRNCIISTVISAVWNTDQSIHQGWFFESRSLELQLSIDDITSFVGSKWVHPPSLLLSNTAGTAPSTGFIATCRAHISSWIIPKSRAAPATDQLLGDSQ